MSAIDYLGVTAFIICLLVAVVGATRRRDVRFALVLGILLRFFMVVVYSNGSDPDVDGYGQFARQFASLDFPDFVRSVPRGAYIYSWLIGVFYRVFGESEVMIRSINALMSSCILFVTHDMVRSVSGAKAAKNATVFLAFFPSLLRFSSPFSSRETLFVLLVMLVVRQTYRFYVTGNVWTLVGGLTCYVLGSVVHTAALFLFPLFVLVLLGGATLGGGRHFSLRLFGVVVLLVVAVLMVANGIGAEKFYFEQGGLSIEKMNWISEGSAVGRASYLAGSTSNDPVMFVLLLPVRIAFLLYAPFVWMIAYFKDLLASMDGLVYLFVSVVVVRNVADLLRNRKRSARDKYLLCLALVLLCMVVGFAIGTSNYGAALRHRAKLICLFVVLCDNRLTWKVRRRKSTQGVVKNTLVADDKTFGRESGSGA